MATMDQTGTTTELPTASASSEWTSHTLTVTAEGNLCFGLSQWDGVNQKKLENRAEVMANIVIEDPTDCIISVAFWLSGTLIKSIKDTHRFSFPFTQIKPLYTKCMKYNIDDLSICKKPGTVTVRWETRPMWETFAERFDIEYIQHNMVMRYFNGAVATIYGDKSEGGVIDYPGKFQEWLNQAIKAYQSMKSFRIAGVCVNSAGVHGPICSVLAQDAKMDVNAIEFVECVSLSSKNRHRINSDADAFRKFTPQLFPGEKIKEASLYVNYGAMYGTKDKYILLKTVIPDADGSFRFQEDSYIPLVCEISVELKFETLLVHDWTIKRTMLIEKLWVIDNPKRIKHEVFNSFMKIWQ